MKRILSVVLVVLLMFSINISAAVNDREILRLEGLGILQGDENGLRLEDNMTRAEFSVIICRLMGVFDAAGGTAKFSDTVGHWAAGYIDTASSAGIIHGIGDNMFAPDVNVKYNEAVKMLVCLLGYESLAQNMGGWPEGFMTQAGLLGITAGCDLSAEFAVRGQIAKMLDNSLDVEILEPEYGKDEAYKLSGRTLYERLAALKHAVTFSGVLNESINTSLLRKTPAVRDGYVFIGNLEYKTSINCAEFLGKAVEGYAVVNDLGEYEIISIGEGINKNYVVTSSGEDCMFSGGYALIYSNDNATEERLNVPASAIFVYNGRKVDSGESYKNLTRANYTFIDNNADSAVDVVFVSESQSLIIEKVNTETGTVFFANHELYKGRKALELTSDKNKLVAIEDKDGNQISVSDIEKSDGITIEASEDLTFIKVIISKETTEGKIEMIDGDGNVTIAGVEYETDESFTLGDEGVFAIDAYGKIIGISSKKKSDLNYGYIADAQREVTGVSGGLKIYLITANEPQKEVKVSHGDETISYYLQNNAGQIFSCADKVRYASDSVNGYGNVTSSASINPADLRGKIVGYKLDADGKITTLNVYSVPTTLSKCTLNAEIVSFGGEAASRGFATNENTQIICIPSTVKSMDDYGVRVYITDSGSYDVYGVKGYSEYDFGSDEYIAEEVDVLLLKTNMDSTQLLPVQNDSDICIVGKVFEAIDDDGENVYRIDMLNGSERKTFDVDEAAFGAVSSLRMGDLIRYAVNGKGEIANIKKLASIQGLGSYYSSSISYWGICTDVVYETYDYLSNEYIDLIEISFEDGKDNKKIKISNQTPQLVYFYNRARGYIQAATTADVMSQLHASDDASKIFALMKDNDAEAIVIIED